MLLELAIQRVALVAELRISLNNGFNVFTGETGAGKSIILDSIGLLLGNRASSDLIRTGEDSAYVEAVFSLTDATREAVESLFSEWGIPEDDHVLVSRELFRTGRTVCRLNGRLATVQMLRELGSLLVQQHGQHDHQGLLKADEQRRALDMFGKYEGLLKDVKSAHEGYIRCKRAYEESQLDEQARAQRLDMLDFQLAEIDEARLQVGEEDALRDRRKKLQHIGKISSALERAYSLLEGIDRAHGAIRQLSLAFDEVSSAAAFDESLSAAAELLQTAHVNADEARHTISKHVEGLEASPSELEDVESRLAVLRGVLRKYGETAEEVLAYRTRIAAERDELTNHEQRTHRLEQEWKSAEKDLHRAAQELHDRRVATAAKLSTEVGAALRNLNMPNAQFKIDVTVNDSRHYTEHGMDTIQFMFSANPGEELKPLTRVASGGELSRTLLALKSVLADVDDIATLIFDEIDTGVSGDTAQRVAEQMVRISHTRQVLCVTHSAALAAAAETHFYIEKMQTSESTTTHVSRLDGNGRVSEVARLLGAGISGETAIGHAKALLSHMGINPEAAPSR